MESPAINTTEAVLSEAGLIQRVLHGEKDLFGLLIRKYNTRLYRVGRSIINDDSAIEDLMQNAYIKAYENLSRFEGRASFGTWLVRIMINESLLYKKKKHNHSPMENSNQEEQGQDGHTPDRLVINKELGRALEQSLTDLPEKYRIVFVLREMEQMSIAETTAVLDLTESNVKVRLNRAKAMLRDKLTSYYKSDVVFHFHLSRCDRIVRRVLASI